MRGNDRSVGGSQRSGTPGSTESRAPKIRRGKLMIDSIGFHGLAVLALSFWCDHRNCEVCVEQRRQNTRLGSRTALSVGGGGGRLGPGQGSGGGVGAGRGAPRRVRRAQAPWCDRGDGARLCRPGRER